MRICSAAVQQLSNYPEVHTCCVTVAHGSFIAEIKAYFLLESGKHGP